MTTYYTTFTVSGIGYFPMDMLRYDACFPLRPSDVESISDARSMEKRTEVQLRHVGVTSDWQPTNERWQSFWWSVVPSSVQTIKGSR